MKNITYLLGAGASVNAIPAVKDFVSALKGYLLKIEDESFCLSETEKFQNIKSLFSKRELQLQFIITAKEVLAHIERWGTFDKYVKILHETKQYDKVNQVKGVLVLLFSLLQADRGVDERYYQFLLSLMKDGVSNMPQNVKILSWNYDNQIEKAYGELINNTSISHIKNYLNVITKYDTNDATVNKFGIIKLNGSCDYNSTFQFSPLYKDLETKCDKDFFEKLLHLYTAWIRKDIAFNFSFAWEIDPFREEKLIHNIALEAAQDTNILVVVGYSFQDFNSAVDQFILKGMNNLESVYIIDKFPKRIIERFRDIRPDINRNRIIPKPINEHYIPKEFFDTLRNQQSAKMNAVA